MYLVQLLLFQISIINMSNGSRVGIVDLKYDIELKKNL